MEKYTNELMEIFEKAKKYDEIAFIKNQNSVICSFCDKRQEDVEKIIASQKALICNECVELCADILKQESVEEVETT